MFRIRPARNEDKPALLEISDLTWDGGDYLSDVMGRWLDEGDFYVAVVDGKVIGTAKISFHPDGVCWLEGLRVHPDYRHLGYGKKLAVYVQNKANVYLETGKSRIIELSTYYHNYESIHIAEETGFEIVAQFFILERQADSGVLIPEYSDLDYNDLERYGPFIPVGWEIMHNCSETLEWISRFAEIFSINGKKFLVSRTSENYTIMDLRKKSLTYYIKAFNYLAKQRDVNSYNIIIPEKHFSIIDPLKKNGFSFWEKTEEPNLLVLSL